jgi:hypothetical protein
MLKIPETRQDTNACAQQPKNDRLLQIAHKPLILR